MDQRFVIIGTTGTGKTMFAAKLATKLGLPHIQGDRFIVLPNWGRRKPVEFAPDLDRATSGPAWVFDGCYSGNSMVPIWPRAETVIWLDYPRWRVHWQLLKRTLHNVSSQQEVHNGNRETWRGAFFNRHSILLYSLTNYDAHRQEFLEIEAKLRQMGKQILVFKSPKQVESYLTAIKLLQPVHTSAAPQQNALPLLTPHRKI